MRPALAWLTAGVAILVLAPWAHARAAGCPPTPHYKVLAAGPWAVVAATRFEQHDDQVTVYRACLRSGRSSWVIAKSSLGIGGADRLSNFRFAGRYVAWLTAFADPRYGGGGEDLHVVDLRSNRHRVIHLSSYADKP